MHIAQVRIRQASPQASEVALDHALRAELGHVRQSLAGSQLAGARATGVDLRRVDLSGADLTRARFEGCDPREADLSRADLTGSGHVRPAASAHAARL